MMWISGQEVRLQSRGLGFKSHSDGHAESGCSKAVKHQYWDKCIQNLYVTMTMKPGLELIMLCTLAQVDLSQSSTEFKSLPRIENK